MKRFVTTPPRNFGRAEKVLPVRDELDWTLSRASAQYVEAFKVDGTNMQYWRKTSEGFYCTCRYGHNHAENTPSADTRVDNPANLDKSAAPGSR